MYIMTNMDGVENEDLSRLSISATVSPFLTTACANGIMHLGRSQIC